MKFLNEFLLFGIQSEVKFQILGQVDKNEAIALDSSSDEEPKSQGKTYIDNTFFQFQDLNQLYFTEKCKNLPKNMESSPLILLNQVKSYSNYFCFQTKIDRFVQNFR